MGLLNKLQTRHLGGRERWDPYVTELYYYYYNGVVTDRHRSLKQSGLLTKTLV